jgi:hypothetical protein
LTVVMSIGAYFFIRNYPNTATFLSVEERTVIHERLKHDSDATRNERFTWSNVFNAFKDPKVWLYGLDFHIQCTFLLYTLSLFLVSTCYILLHPPDTDSVIAHDHQKLSYKTYQAQLMTVPPYAVAFILTLTVAVLSERLRLRAPFIMGLSCVAIGYIILLSQHRPGVSYFGTILAAGGIYPTTAIVLAWPANNVSGQTKRCTANAMQISIGNLGAVLGTQLYRTESAPRFFLGHAFALDYLVANVLVVGLLWLVLKRENERRDRGERGGRLQGVTEADWLGNDDPRWRFQA